MVLTELKPQLVEQSQLVKKALEQVERDSKKAREKEIVVSAEAEQVNQQKYDIQVVKDEAQYELDQVLPQLEEARKAVENIDRPGLINLRSY